MCLSLSWPNLYSVVLQALRPGLLLNMQSFTVNKTTLVDVTTELDQMAANDVHLGPTSRETPVEDQNALYYSPSVDCGGALRPLAIHPELNNAGRLKPLGLACASFACPLSWAPSSPLLMDIEDVIKPRRAARGARCLRGENLSMAFPGLGGSEELYSPIEPGLVTKHQRRANGRVPGFAGAIEKEAHSNPDFLWSGFNSYRGVCVPVQRKQQLKDRRSLGWRKWLVDHKATCFWHSVLHVIHPDELKKLDAVCNRMKVDHSAGVSEKTAVQVLAKIALVVYAHNPITGQVDRVSGIGDRGVMFVWCDDVGRYAPHWLPVANVTKRVCRLSHDALVQVVLGATQAGAPQNWVQMIAEERDRINPNQIFMKAHFDVVDDHAPIVHNKRRALRPVRAQVLVPEALVETDSETSSDAGSEVEDLWDWDWPMFVPEECDPDGWVTAGEVEADLFSASPMDFMAYASKEMDYDFVEHREMLLKFVANPIMRKVSDDLLKCRLAFGGLSRLLPRPAWPNPFRRVYGMAVPPLVSGDAVWLHHNTKEACSGAMKSGVPRFTRLEAAWDWCLGRGARTMVEARPEIIQGGAHVRPGTVVYHTYVEGLQVQRHRAIGGAVKVEKIAQIIAGPVTYEVKEARYEVTNQYGVVLAHTRGELSLKDAPWWHRLYMRIPFVYDTTTDLALVPERTAITDATLALIPTREGRIRTVATLVRERVEDDRVGLVNELRNEALGEPAAGVGTFVGAMECAFHVDSILEGIRPDRVRAYAYA